MSAIPYHDFKAVDRKERTDPRYDMLREGDRLGQLCIRGPLGSHREPTVYAALELESGRAVAVKLCQRRLAADGRLESADRAVQRLRREAEVLRLLDHPAVPRLLWSAESQDPPHLVLELIDAVEFEDFLADRTDPMPASGLADLLARLADVLADIHERGFVHGDLKPSNVLVHADGAPVIIDFGSTRRWDETATDGPSSISLTPGYAAPECHDSNGQIGPWSDIYALGALAYRTVTGRAPISAEARVCGDPMPGAVEVGSALYPLALRAAIDWTLELDPTARPASLDEWQGALRAAFAHTEAGSPTIRIRRRALPAKAHSFASDRAGLAVIDSARSRARRRVRVALGLLGMVLVGPVLWGVYRLHDERTRLEWLVDPTGAGDTRSISEALSRVPGGATIRVKPGVYRETLSIERSVNIIGLAEDDRLPAVEPNGARCVSARAEAARLSRIVFRSPDDPGGREAGIPCFEIARGRLSIEHAEITARGPAIVVHSGAELRLSESTVSGAGAAGITAGSGARLEIAGGSVGGVARSGIIARGGAELVVSDLSIDGAGQAGVLLAEGAVARLKMLRITASGSSGLEVLGGASALVLDSVIDRSAQVGIFVADGAKIVTERTRVSNSGYSGVIAATAADISMTGSQITSNREHGLVVMDMAAATVRESELVENAGHGIALEPLARLDAEANTVERNKEPQIVDNRRPDPARQSATR